MPRFTVSKAQLAKLEGKAKEHKYRVASKGSRQADGITFDSRRELKRYQALKLAREVGEVMFFLRQVPFHIPGGVYRADFLVFWRDGTLTIEDVKGFRTEEYKRKKRAVEKAYPIEITEL